MDWINQLLRKVPTWLVYIVGLIPVPLFLYLAQTGGLGREPIKALEHELGELALKLIIVGLAITPLRKIRWAELDQVPPFDWGLGLYLRGPASVGLVGS